MDASNSAICGNQTMIGRWAHLAVVVNGDVRQVTHSFNGEPVSNHEVPELPQLHFDTTCIGNWSEPVYRVLIRNLSGIINELTIHDRRLCPAEIHTITG